jgi:hypothetical protein
LSAESAAGDFQPNEKGVRETIPRTPVTFNL